MNNVKKSLALALAVIMVISLIPVAAMADEVHSCKENAGAWISNGDVTHSSYCNICGELVDGPSECQSFNGKTCYMCKGSMTPHVHKPATIKGNWEEVPFTHTYYCACGEEYMTEECDLSSGSCSANCGNNCVHTNYVDGLCDVCGAEDPNYMPEENEKPEEPACNGLAVEWISNEDGTHNANCACGEHNEVQNCNYGATGKCYQCGYKPAEEKPACNGFAVEWISNEDGTHNANCACGEHNEVQNCNYGATGKCYQCGYKPAEHECTMDELVSISETQHQFQCECGEFVGVAMNHDDSDGDRFCNGCGYEMYEEIKCDHEGGAWISNGDGTHTSSCECGENVTEGPCYDLGKGVCYMCGYEFPVEEHECDFAAGVTSNEDGTHDINCSCGEVVTVNCLDNDGDGKCDSCGYVKYVHKCDFEAGVTSNEDGTHDVNCSCGEAVTVNCLDSDGDNYCDSCGYELYEEPEETVPSTPVKPIRPTLNLGNLFKNLFKNMFKNLFK